jgi:TonB family protein
MNRLQKKCVMATAGIHLLLLVILFVGPAFFYSRPKADDLQVLDVIPANLIDAAFNSGVANAAPPPPAPVTPPPPAPAVTPPAPLPPKMEPPKPVIKEMEKALTPLEKPTPLHKSQINTQLVTRTTPKASPNANDAARARAIRTALLTLKKNFSPGTTIDMPGNSSVAYANYATVVKNVYDQTWMAPATVLGADEVTKASVTIASDGTVISARIVTPSGDANLDASVQQTLERVKFIAPFPEGATEKERTYPISFNPELKRMLE